MRRNIRKQRLKQKAIRLGISMGVGLCIGLIILVAYRFILPENVREADIRRQENGRLTLDIPQTEESIPMEEGISSGEILNGLNDIKRVNILAVGDDLIHTGIFKSGLKEDGTYNFDHLYANVKEDIQAADLAIVNQETIFTNDRSNYSGYPAFGGPVEIGDGLAAAGFDVVTHATNHTFDRHVQGIEDTLNFWSTKHPEMTILGAHLSQEDADTIKTVECNGITFALLNYTYGLNGFVLPEGQEYLVDQLEESKVAEDIARAKEISDCVIFFLHSGDEYVYQPSDYTKYWVEFLLEHEVDITIASHPHVLEPYGELISSTGHRMVVYYSMGNFISTQDEMPRMIGGMAKLTVEMRGSGENAQVSVVDYTMDPLFTHYNHDLGIYTVYKLSDYTEALAAQHALYNKYETPMTLDVIRAKYDEIMSTVVDQPGAASIYQPYIEDKKAAAGGTAETTAETEAESIVYSDSDAA